MADGDGQAESTGLLGQTGLASCPAEAETAPEQLESSGSPLFVDCKSYRAAVVVRSVPGSGPSWGDEPDDVNPKQ